MALTATPNSGDCADEVEVSLPRATRGEKWALAAITATFVSLVAFRAALAPMFDAPDEPLHFNSAVRLIDGGGWPEAGEAKAADWILAATAEAGMPKDARSTVGELRDLHPGYSGLDQMTQHPPVYYAYIAAVLTVFDYEDMGVDEAVLVARLAGLIFALPLPLAAWDSVRRLTRSSRAGLVAAASLLAVPQLAHIMGSVSNDSMAVGFSALVVWLGIRIMTGDTSWITTGGIGLALALVLTSKGTALPLVAFVAVVVLFWPRLLSLRQRVWRTIAAMALGAIGGAWWLRNLIVFGAIQPNSTLYDTLPWADGTGPSTLEFSEYAWSRISRSFWGNFGWLAHPMPGAVTDTLTVVCCAVIVGYAYRRSSARIPALVLTATVAVLFVALMARTWSGYARTHLPAGLQGRYFFVVIIALIALSAIAWRNLVPAAERTRACYLLLTGFALVAILGVYIEWRYIYDGFADVLVRSPIGAWGFGFIGLAAAGFGVLTFALTVVHIRSAKNAMTAAEVVSHPSDEPDPGVSVRVDGNSATARKSTETTSVDAADACVAADDQAHPNSGTVGLDDAAVASEGDTRSA
ncbi:MAG: DUF2142 domain-containing protein [Cumulibacter sp.]